MILMYLSEHFPNMKSTNFIIQSRLFSFAHPKENRKKEKGAPRAIRENFFFGLRTRSDIASELRQRSPEELDEEKVFTHRRLDGEWVHQLARTGEQNE